MKCNHCNKELKTDNRISSPLKSCPFCGESLKKKEDHKFYDNSKDALAAIMNKFGAEVLLGKINAYFSDFAPDVSARDKSLVYSVYEKGAAEILKNNLNSSQTNKERAIKQAVKKLTVADIPPDRAATIINEFAAALGWQLSKPTPITPMRRLTFKQILLKAAICCVILFLISISWDHLILMKELISTIQKPAGSQVHESESTETEAKAAAEAKAKKEAEAKAAAAAKTKRLAEEKAAAEAKAKLEYEPDEPDNTPKPDTKPKPVISSPAPTGDWDTVTAPPAPTGDWDTATAPPAPAGDW